MLQVARLAPKFLGESAGLVKDFLFSQLNDDGGFKDRAGRSDLYYTVFGLDGLVALQAELPVERVEPFLRRFGNGEGLDLVHLCCLARCWAALEKTGSNFSGSRLPSFRNELLRRVEALRARDGGYNPVAAADFGTAYGGFLAMGAYEDLHGQLPEPQRLAEGLKSLATGDGAWTNERNAHIKTGSTNATAAAVAVLRHLGVALQPAAGEWLLARCHREGGFLAMPNAPLPDLLSTATALHALAGLQIPLDRVKEPCLDFIDTLWTNAGGFHGHWGDDALDCEYTFYGLLALGHLV